MSRNEKRLLSIISIALVMLACSILARKYFMISYSAPREELAAGFHCVTDVSQPIQTHDGDIITASQTFLHNIYTSEEHDIADLHVTVTASVTPSGCTISHISTSLSNQQWDGLTVSDLTAADTATVILFQDQLSICHFQYRISPDGEIEYLH